MTAFVAAAVALALLASGAVLFGPRREPPGDVSQSRSNAAVLRQQLAELEGERARGLLDETEFARSRDELRRRLLAEQDSVAVPQGGARSRRALVAYAAALPVAAALLYLHFGHPQLLGAPPAAQQAAIAGAAGDDGEKLLAQLEAHVAASPGDARAWVMLGRLPSSRRPCWAPPPS